MRLIDFYSIWIRERTQKTFLEREREIFFSPTPRWKNKNQKEKWENWVGFIFKMKIWLGFWFPSPTSNLKTKISKFSILESENEDAAFFFHTRAVKNLCFEKAWHNDDFSLGLYHPSLSIRQGARAWGPQGAQETGRAHQFHPGDPTHHW